MIPPPTVEPGTFPVWHTVIGILSLMISGLWVLALFILRRVWTNIDLLHSKLDGIGTKMLEYMQSHYECQVDLPNRYVSLDTWNNWHKEWETYLGERQKEREDYWSAFNGHKHDRESGGVIRRNGK